MPTFSPLVQERRRDILHGYWLLGVTQINPVSSCLCSQLGRLASRLQWWRPVFRWWFENDRLRNERRVVNRRDAMLGHDYVVQRSKATPVPCRRQGVLVWRLCQEWEIGGQEGHLNIFAGFHGFPKVGWALSTSTCSSVVCSKCGTYNFLRDMSCIIAHYIAVLHSSKWLTPRIHFHDLCYLLRKPIINKAN